MIFKNKNLEIMFDDNPKFIKHIFLPDNEKICVNGEQTILVRTATAVSEPVILSQVTHVPSGMAGLHLIFSDSSNQYLADMVITEKEHGIFWRVNVSAPEPIWLIEWKISGLNFDEVIIPALGGQALKKEMPAETTLSYKYPFWWNAQFVIGKTDRGGLMLHSRDARPNLKLLRVGKDPRGFSLTYGYEAPAPLTNRKLAAEWYLNSFAGDWQVAVDEFREWLEKAFLVKPLEEKPHYPSWAKRINFVLEMWGARRDYETPMHTFAQMTKRLREFENLHSPENTLLYLPGFAEHGIDSHAPDYNPSPQCGGEIEFKKLIDTTHDLGYRIMIHTNVLAMTFNHRLYPKFKQHQVVDCFDRPQGWGLDLDGDWLAEPFFAYINPGAVEWGDLMEQVIGDLIKNFNIDGVFLDQTLLAFNVSNGPNFLTGMREHISRLQSAFPDILFAGEGMHEHVCGALPMAQIHGIDSIAEVHGIEGQRPWREAHPVSTYLFEKYIKFTPHLLTKHPSHPMFASQEAAYKILRVLPALCLYNSSQTMDLPAVREMIERAKKM